MPVSNADIGQTIAKLMNLPIAKDQKGPLIGRVAAEALSGGRETTVTRGELVSPAAANGLKTVVHYEQVGATKYFKAAGFAGRTAGLDDKGRPDHLEDSAR
jgi:hypothetical protein